jgi:hypothetical protein
MMYRVTSIIFLLVFALLIQNTCPLGAAGKTSAATSCHTCPSNHGLSISTDGLMSVASDSSSIHFPLYVFAVSKTIHTFRLEPIKPKRLPIGSSYADALSSEFLRPPRA